jgi:hypothetical protein
MDREIGELIDQLKNSGIDKNTLVISPVITDLMMKAGQISILRLLKKYI